MYIHTERAQRLYTILLPRWHGSSTAIAIHKTFKWKSRWLIPFPRDIKTAILWWPWHPQLTRTCPRLFLYSYSVERAYVDSTPLDFKIQCIVHLMSLGKGIILLDFLVKLRCTDIVVRVIPLHENRDTNMQLSRAHMAVCRKNKIIDSLLSFLCTIIKQTCCRI